MSDRLNPNLIASLTAIRNALMELEIEGRTVTFAFNGNTVQVEIFDGNGHGIRETFSFEELDNLKENTAEYCLRRRLRFLANTL